MFCQSTFILIDEPITHVVVCPNCIGNVHVFVTDAEVDDIVAMVYSNTLHCYVNGIKLHF